MKFFVLLIAICAGCASQTKSETFLKPETLLEAEKQEEPPIEVEGDTVEELISEAISEWLNTKMEVGIYNALKGDLAFWRKVQRVSGVVAWFDGLAVTTDNVAWTNFYYLIEELRWIPGFSLSEPTYLKIIKATLSCYVWQEDDEF